MPSLPDDRNQARCSSSSRGSIHTELSRKNMTSLGPEGSQRSQRNQAASFSAVSDYTLPLASVPSAFNPDPRRPDRLTRRNAGFNPTDMSNATDREGSLALISPFLLEHTVVVGRNQTTTSTISSPPNFEA